MSNLNPPSMLPTLPLATSASLALAGLLLAAAAAQAQQIELRPGPTVLAGDPVSLRVTGLKPGTEVQIQARRLVPAFTGGLQVFESQARYVADAQGAVDVSTQAPGAGSSYSGVDARGLFWSMVPTRQPAEGLAPHQVMVSAQVAGQPVARAQLSLPPALPAVQQRSADPFPGARFASLPTPGAERPGLIVLGGSEGGSLITRDAPIWASRGYAVLALPYYSPAGWGPNGPTPPELPSLPAQFADIPVERLAAARDWLAQQPEVDANRIGVMGTSKGAEFALLAALKMPWIRSVVAIVPTDVVWEGWGDGVAPGSRASFAWQGKPYAFVPSEGFAQEFQGFATGQPVRIRRPLDQGRAAHPDRVAPARIPVEDITAPVLVAGGMDDQIWSSGTMTQAIAERRRAAGRDTVALVFPEAGHYLGGTGWSPTTHYDAGPMKSGGQPAANARAQAQTFQATVDFLARTLGPLPQ